jgi:deoxyribodipyrimidine photo-lyase
VDERSALAEAKRKLYELRATPEARDEAGAIQQKHGSRRSGLPPSGVRARKAPAADLGQGSLF